jgi:hypothetical protein
MPAYLDRLVERVSPIGKHVVCVIMGSVTDGREDMASECFLGDLLRTLPKRIQARPEQRAVAGERELATGWSPGSFVHNPADARRITGMPNAVEHHLSHGPAAVRTLARCFIVDGLGQTGGSALPVVGRGLEHEAPGGGIGTVREGPFGVLLQRLLWRHGFEEIWRR